MQMKKENGITLASLVITVILLLLISTVTARVSLESYQGVKLQNFISQLKVIQSKVDNIAEETNDVSSYGFTSLSAIAETNPEDYDLFVAMLANPEEYQIDKTISWQESSDTNIGNYYYFNAENLEKLGLKNQKITVIINFETRNVIAKDGIKVEGKMYYRQYDLLEGDQLK